MSKKQIHLNGFVQQSPSPHSIGLWKHEKDKVHLHGDIEYWTHLAQTLEKGKFDALFMADVLGTYSAYENSHRTATEYAVQFPAYDPIAAISAMAAVTKHLGFAPTVSTTYAKPYQLVRQLSTLDHLSKGRIGWNVVTSFLESEAVNLGLTERLPKETRYDRADEFLEVTYKLWEKSWDDQAIVRDIDSDTYTDPDKVNLIHHKGKFLNVPGPHLVDPSPQRTPVIFQAGASSRGRDFAAKHAESVFTTQHSLDACKAYVADVRARAEKFGRDKNTLLFLPLIMPIIGDTEEAAEEKLQALVELMSYEGTAALLSGHTGIDFSLYDSDQYLESIETGAIQHAMDRYTKDPNCKWTLREAIKFHGSGTGPVRFVGTPEKIADQLEEWIRVADVDGFNVAQAYSPGTLEAFVEKVVPVLQERGIYRQDYEGETLRENLFGQGAKYIREDHPARQLSN